MRCTISLSQPSIPVLEAIAEPYSNLVAAGVRLQQQTFLPSKTSHAYHSIVEHEGVHRERKVSSVVHEIPEYQPGSEVEHVVHGFYKASLHALFIAAEVQ